MEFIDLTQTFTNDMPVYPGDSKPELIQVVFFDKDGYNAHEIKTGIHVGTHMDAPLHMIANGKKISEIVPGMFFGHGVLIDARGKEKIDVDLLHDVQAGDIVLILTGFGSRFLDSDYYKTYPELTEAFARKLVELHVKMVGADTPSPDREPFLIHKILLAQEILILENLTNLEKLLGKNFEVMALPAKLATDGAPVRVIAKIK